MMISLASISCLAVAIGGIVMFAGLILMIKQKRLAGGLVALLGVCLMVIPALLILYIGMVMH